MNIVVSYSIFLSPTEIRLTRIDGRWMDAPCVHGWEYTMHVRGIMYLSTSSTPNADASHALVFNMFTNYVVIMYYSMIGPATHACCRHASWKTS